MNSKPKSVPPASGAVWSWKSNPDPWRKGEAETWEEYLPDLNIKIETAFAKKEPKVEIGEYFIQFGDMRQYKKSDISRQRPVKRVEGASVKKSMRMERFTGPLPNMKKMTMSDAFGNIKHFIDLLEKKAHSAFPELVKVRHVRYRKFSTNEEKTIISTTIGKSLMAEAIIFSKDPSVSYPDRVLHDAQDIAKMVEDACSTVAKDFEKIWTAFCIALIKAYTKETFLYKRLNQILREENWNGLTNLAPFGYYLMQAIVYIYRTHKFNLKECTIAETKPGFIKLKLFDKPSSIFLYRGSALPEDLIVYYDSAKTKYFSWNAFVSTSKLPDVARRFSKLNKKAGTCSAFFAIEAKVGSRQMTDISKYSEVQDEAEVVLVPGTIFQIKESKQVGDTYEITLQIVEDVEKVKEECVTLRGPAIISLEDVKHSIRNKETIISLKGIADQELEELIALLMEGKDFISKVNIYPLAFSPNGTKKVIEALCKLPNLQSLDLKDNSFSVDLLKFMASLLSGSSVQTLSLGLFEALVGEEELDYGLIFKALYKSLSTLQLAGEIYNEMSNKGIASLWETLSHSEITKLILSNLKITSTLIEQVKNSFINKIEELVLDHVDLDGKDIELALQISKLSLKKLHLTIPPYKDLEGFYKALGKGLTDSSITELTLQGAHLPNPSCTITPTLKKAGLTERYYYDAIFDDFETFTACLPKTKLSSLVINNVWMSVQSLVKLLTVLPKTNITRLYLGLSLYPRYPGEKALKITQEYAQMLVDFSNVIDLPTMEVVRKKDEKLILETFIKVLPAAKIKNLGINFKDAAKFEFNHDETKQLDEFMRKTGINKFNVSLDLN